MDLARELWPLSLTQESYRQRFVGHAVGPINVSFGLDMDDVEPARIATDLRALSRVHPLLTARFDGEWLSFGDPPPPAAVVELAAVDLPARMVEHSRLMFHRDHPMWNAEILRLDDGRTVVLFAFHHMIFDGVSRARVVGSLATESPTTAPPYVEFARWQRARFADAGPHLEFWRRHFDGTPHNRHVPLPFARGLEQKLDEHCGEVTHTIGGTALWRCLRVCRQERLSLFMLALSALSVVLGELTGEPDNTVRATFHGRPDGFEDTVGCFGHDVVFRLPTASVPIGQAVRTTRSAYESLGDHRYTPYRLVREAAGASTLPYRPVVVTLNALSLPSQADAFGTKVTVVETPERLPEEGLHILMSQRPNEAVLTCTYHPVRFAETDVRAFVARVAESMLSIAE